MILRDPAVESLSSFIGADGANTTLNSGRMSINLKPLEVRRIGASDVIRRLQKSLEPVEGITLYMQPVQNITIDDRVSRTQYQYTLEDPDSNELNHWTDRFVDKLKQLPQLADVATDRQNGGLAASLVIDRVTASRLGIAPSTIDNTLYDAFGQRQINTLYTQLNQYHVILEALPDFQREPKMLQKIYIQANTSSGASGPGATSSFAASAIAAAGSNALTAPVRYTPSSGVLIPPRNAIDAGVGATGGPATNVTSSSNSANAVPLSAFTPRADPVAAFDQSPGSVSRGNDILQPGARRRAWQCDIGCRTSPAGSQDAAQRAGRVPGHSGGFPGILSPTKGSSSSQRWSPSTLFWVCFMRASFTPSPFFPRCLPRGWARCWRSCSSVRT